MEPNYPQITAEARIIGFESSVAKSWIIDF